jgi:GR25 family glycosyltransferase involved in LPS biosynthesis
VDIHVINLDRCADRLSAFQALNGHLPLNFVRFPAVDGRNIVRGPLVDSGIIATDLCMRDGSLGCTLSHLALWDLAIERNQPLTICEDDAIFNCGFGRAAEAQLQALPPDWHIILWGWNFDSILLFDLVPGVSPCLSIFDQARMRMGIEAFRSAQLTPQPFRLFNTFGLPGYSISPTGAREIKRCCLPVRNMDIYIPGLGGEVANEDVDIMLNAAYRHIQAYVCFPPLIITKNADSTIVRSPDGTAGG